MLWDVWEAFVDWVKLTLTPALKNLFSSKKNFIGMFLAVLILQTLLCVICIAGVSNIVGQNALLNDVEKYVAHDNELKWAVEVISNSTMILIGALCIWAVCAITLYWKMTVAAADRSRYVWGMFVCYGSARKKILKMLLCELNITMLVALAISYPVAYFICIYVAPPTAKIFAYPGSFWLALIIVLIAVRLCAGFQTRLIYRNTCVSLLSGEGVIENIISPRMSGRLIFGFTPFRISKTVFWRSRRYYASLALAAALPAVIWVCCQTASFSEMTALEEDIEEFVISAPTGLSSDILELEYFDELDDINGVSSIRAEAKGSGYAFGIHVLVESDNVTGNTEYVKLNELCADSNFSYVSSDDPSFFCNTGVSYKVDEGEAVLVLGNRYQHDIYDENDKEIDTKEKYLLISPSAEKLEYPKNLLDDNYKYLKLKIKDTVSNVTNGLNFNLNGVFVILNPNDYEKITNVGSEYQNFTVNSDIFEINTSTYNDGSFQIKVKKSLLERIPEVGGAIIIENSSIAYYAEMDFLNQDKTKDEAENLEHLVRNGVINPKMYMIYEVEEAGDTVCLRVAPQGVSIVMKMFPLGDKLTINIGTPLLSGSRLKVIARNPNTDFLVSYSTVTLSGIAEFDFMSDVVAEDVKSFMVLETADVADTKGTVLLEDVYATNDFTLVCADNITPASMGFKNIDVSDGEAVVVVPKLGNVPFTVDDGQNIFIAKSIPFDPLDYEDNFKFLNNKIYLLQRQMEASEYQYEQLSVNEVIESDVNGVYIFVDEKVYSTIIGLEKPYTQLDVLIKSDVSPVEYSSITAELAEWVRLTTTEEEPISFASLGEYFGIMLRAAADYSVWLRVIAIMTPLLIPMIWYYPQSMTFARRRNDCRILLDIGRRKRELRRMFLWEALMVAGVAALGVIVLTPIGILLFDVTIDLFEMPLEFDFAAFDVVSFVLALGVSAVCAAMTVVVGGEMAILPKRKMKRKEKGENGAS